MPWNFSLLYVKDHLYLAVSGVCWRFWTYLRKISSYKTLWSIKLISHHLSAAAVYIISTVRTVSEKKSSILVPISQYTLAWQQISPFVIVLTTAGLKFINTVKETRAAWYICVNLYEICKANMSLTDAEQLFWKWCYFIFTAHRTQRIKRRGNRWTVQGVSGSV